MSDEHVMTADELHEDHHILIGYAKDVGWFLYRPDGLVRWTGDQWNRYGDGVSKYYPTELEARRAATAIALAEQRLKVAQAKKFAIIGFDGIVKCDNLYHITEPDGGNRVVQRWPDEAVEAFERHCKEAVCQQPEHSQIIADQWLIRKTEDDDEN